MKYLCIDYGLKRIGLATSDLGGTIASPFHVVQNKGELFVIHELIQIIREEKVGKIVLGLPLHVDGNDSDMTRTVREFGKKLENKSGIPIDFHRETYSSKEAEEHIRFNLGIRDPKKVKELVDKMAAAMVLQEYLEDKQ